MDNRTDAVGQLLIIIGILPSHTHFQDIPLAKNNPKYEDLLCFSIKKYIINFRSL